MRFLIATSGLLIEKIVPMNTFLAFSWWLNFCVLKKKTFSRLTFFLADCLAPFFALFDRLYPGAGLDLLAACTKVIDFTKPLCYK